MGLDEVEHAVGDHHVHRFGGDQGVPGAEFLDESGCLEKVLGPGDGLGLQGGVELCQVQREILDPAFLILT